MDYIFLQLAAGDLGGLSLRGPIQTRGLKAQQTGCILTIHGSEYMNYYTKDIYWFDVSHYIKAIFTIPFNSNPMIYFTSYTFWHR